MPFPVRVYVCIDPYFYCDVNGSRIRKYGRIRKYIFKAFFNFSLKIVQKIMFNKQLRYILCSLKNIAYRNLAIPRAKRVFVSRFSCLCGYYVNFTVIYTIVQINNIPNAISRAQEWHFSLMCVFAPPQSLLSFCFYNFFFGDLASN